jgi:TonB family protein
MTLTTKSFPDPVGPGKPGTSPQNPENSAGQSPRSNPVCLEVAVTIRNTPAENGSTAQPFREEGRTVIVFDNGAVIRSTSSLPIGQTFVLSNQNGSEVVCRVVGGRNLPSVKGYAEVEFVQPVKDFWSLHQDAGTVSVAPPPPAPMIPREPVAPIAPPPIAPPPVPRAAIPLDPPSKPGSVVLGSGPSFDDIPGLDSRPVIPMPRDTKAPSTRLGPERLPKIDSDYSLSGIAEPTSVASWRPPDSELPPEKRAIAAMREALSTGPPVPVSKPPREFMAKGLTAYQQPRSSSGESSSSTGRMPLILGAAAVVLVIVGAVVYYMRQGSTPAAVAKADVPSQALAPEPPAIKSDAKREPAQAPAQARTQNQQAFNAESAPPAANNAPVPAVVTSSAPSDSRTDSASVRRLEENAAAAKQANNAAPRRSAIPNLKIGSPSAPNQNLSNTSDDAAPLTDISSTEAVGGTPSASLLTSSGRISNAPAPPVALEPATAPFPAPVSAPVSAQKVVRDPKLISSIRPVYPPAAKQSNIQGAVSVTVNIDANGKVVAVRALSGPMLLRQAAEDAVKQWRYSPGTVDGKPAPSQVTLNVDFRLN